ncbi:DNA-protecting protein DprA [Entomohabitans teleogrylli]|uniref:DNA-protecting protein DprA n=1 Tax=Entomohabitans teleogrylli TaxID=1384589 RepID=UPI00073D9D7F|nr:DNA-protecting protein DprA [Entomohabitans teleogrylli]
MQMMEIWLRLMAVYGLSGEKMLQAAAVLRHMPENPACLLPQSGLSPRQCAQFKRVTPQYIEKVLRWLDAADHHFITAESKHYPLQLRAIDWFPGGLFVAGDIALLTRPQLAVVGSRLYSWYGERWGRILCQSLAAMGVVITSGLALGIDGIAHRAALAAGGKTVAVLGNGFPDIYPRSHQDLGAALLEAGGAIVSEFSFHEPPHPRNFPRRNRIISGLSKGVLVVEAALRSGSLVTARYALEQGRDVFAIPGPIGNPGCEGTHWLLKQGAIPVTEAEDILNMWQNSLNWLPEPSESAEYSENQQQPPLPFPELLANVGDEVTPVDVVAERAGQPVPVTVAQLLELELAGWIAAVPGGYVRLRRASHVRRTHLSV